MLLMTRNPRKLASAEKSPGGVLPALLPTILMPRRQGLLIICRMWFLCDTLQNAKALFSLQNRCVCKTMQCPKCEGVKMPQIPAYRKQPMPIIRNCEPPPRGAAHSDCSSGLFGGEATLLSAARAPLGLAGLPGDTPPSSLDLTLSAQGHNQLSVAAGFGEQGCMEKLCCQGQAPTCRSH